MKYRPKLQIRVMCGVKLRWHLVALIPEYPTLLSIDQRINLWKDHLSLETFTQLLVKAYWSKESIDVLVERETVLIRDCDGPRNNGVTSRMSRDSVASARYKYKSLLRSVDATEH